MRIIKIVFLSIDYTSIQLHSISMNSGAIVLSICQFSFLKCVTRPHSTGCLPSLVSTHITG